jgi:glycosyltransferase involved in cell wall biosynthesis
VKILLFTQFCTPEPIFKSLPFAAELRRRGHEVRILTGYPNYPGGKVYPGYRLGLWLREEMEGIPLLRVPLFPSHGASTVGRLANYCSFTAAAALPLLTGWMPDVLYAYNLPTLGVLGALLQRVRHVPYVLDVQDLWPDSVLSSSMGRSWMAGPLHRLCQQAYGSATRVVTLAPGMATRLIGRGVRRDRIRHIYNWCDETDLPGADGGESLPAGMAGRFNVLYAGNHGTVQGLEAVVEAAALAALQNPAIQFIFLGDGVRKPALRERARAVAPSNTLFLDPLPPAKAYRLMTSADALVLSLAPGPLVDITIPSKTQSYLRMGRPILASIGKDAADLVTEAGAGVTCQPGKPEAIADAAIQLARCSPNERARMGSRGKEYYRTHLCLKVGVDRWEQVFDEAMGSSH